LRHRKAISTIFAALLMTSIVAVVGMTVVYSGISTLVESSAAMQGFTEYSKWKVQERFVIDDVWFNSTDSTNQTTVYVINTGNISVEIEKVTFNETIVTLDPEEKLGIDQSAEISIPYTTFPWASGEVFFIQVISDRGNVYGSYWKAP